jgi:hypothetical protein
MDINITLRTNTNEIPTSTFFEALEQCDQEKGQGSETGSEYQIHGNPKILSYLFSPLEIDFNQILEYWTQSTYYNLKTDDLMEKIINHINQPMIRSPWIFQQLILINQRTCGKLPIDQLFENTQNLPEIYDSLRTDEKSSYMAFIFNSKFDQFSALTHGNDYLFNVFEIISNKKNYQIKEFMHQLQPDEQSFLQKFNQLTHGLIDQTFDWTNVCCAGGMVLESMSLRELNPHTDIDLFLYGSHETQAQKAQELCEYFYHKATELSSRAWFGLNQSVITICFEQIPRVIQIICSLAQDLGTVITDFDIYSNSVLYDGISVMGIKKWFDAMRTRVTEYNSEHFLKIKRIYKTIRKGFQFNKNYHLTEDYLEYIESGKAEKEYGTYYYPCSFKDLSQDLIDMEITKMCECYHVKEFTTQCIDPSDITPLNHNHYFESMEDNGVILDALNIRSEPGNRGEQKLFINLNGDDQKIIFSTNYFPCPLAHKKMCTGCIKSENGDQFFHMCYNNESVIQVGKAFDDKYEKICRSIERIKNFAKIDPWPRKHFVKVSDGAKITLNGKIVTMDQIHELYQNKIYDQNDPDTLPRVRVKCCVKSYFDNGNGMSYFVIRCVCAEFILDQTDEE